MCYCARICELEGVDSFFSVRNVELALRLFRVSQIIFTGIILLKINMVHVHCDAVWKQLTTESFTMFASLFAIQGCPGT